MAGKLKKSQTEIRTGIVLQSDLEELLITMTFSKGSPSTSPLPPWTRRCRRSSWKFTKLWSSSSRPPCRDACPPPPSPPRPRPTPRRKRSPRWTCPCLSRSRSCPSSSPATSGSPPTTSATSPGSCRPTRATSTRSKRRRHRNQPSLEQNIQVRRNYVWWDLR